MRAAMRRHTSLEGSREGAPSSRGSSPVKIIRAMRKTTVAERAMRGASRRAAVVVTRSIATSGPRRAWNFAFARAFPIRIGLFQVTA